MIERAINELPRFANYYNALFLLQALLATFLLSAIGCLVGLLVGFLLAVIRHVKPRLLLPVRILVVFYVETFRRVPFLVTLMLVFFGLQALRIDLSTFAVAVISVCLIATAYIAEIIRGGLDSVHHNQWDAAATLNFTTTQTLTYVIVPQAWKVILPPAFSFFILFIKDTALASQIGVVELTYAGTVLNNKGFSALLSFGTILLLYFILSYPLSRFGIWMEARLASPRDQRS